ncbi:MAG: LysM domain-containing protein [Desulfurobacteriaceae bacterium]
MVRLAFLIALLLCNLAFGEVYKIKIVKKKVGESIRGSGLIIYKVKKGDTLWGIVKKFKLPKSSIKTIARINKIKNPDIIYVGQKIKIPIGTKSEGKILLPQKSKEKAFFPVIRMLGGETADSGGLILKSGKVDFSKHPKISIGGKDYVLDFGNTISKRVQKEVESLGIRVLKSQEELKKLLEKEINSQFGIVKKNGELILGLKDILIYHYDYLSYNPSTGNRIVINLKRDTPETLVKLLNAYSIEVTQPEGKDLEGIVGKLKVLTGGGVDKIAQLVKLLTGKSAKTTENGIEFENLHLFVAFDFIDPEEKVKKELDGYKVVVLSGNLPVDLDNVLSALSVAHKWTRFTVLEPPGTEGTRSKFSIMGIWLSTLKEEWFLIDSVDKPEEIPYLRSRGMNLIIY